MTFKQGGIKVMAFVLALAMALTVIPGLAFAADLSPELRAAYDALTIHNADDVRESLNLPSVGENGAAITWASSDESIVSTKEIENEGYFPTPAGVVTRPAADTEVTLTATLTLGGESVEKVFDLTVKAAPDNSVSALEVDNSEDGAYLFVYFTNNGKAEQQIYFAVSKDGLNWTELNNRYPVLISTLGDRAVRDPYIIRSNEGDRFYLIATDLDASGGDWTGYQYNGSKNIMVWESTDLINWSDQRELLASTLPEQGCTWAPEVTYDPETQNYVIYWSSKMTDGSNPRYKLNAVYYATTRDFVTMNSEKPELFVEGKLGQTGIVEPGADNYNENITVIDTTVLQSEVDNKFYRVTKHEGESKVFIESSDKLLGKYEPIAGANVYTNPDFAGVEGPELYRLKDGRYCLLLDRFGNGGYMAAVTEDLSTGVFSKMTEASSFPVARHGGVLKITDEEYDRVLNYYNNNAEAAAPGEAGSGPIAAYDFNDGTAKDTTGNGNDGKLIANAAVVDDAEKGKALSLDGSTDAYMELPVGLLDGRNELTVSMDVLHNNANNDNYFNFALGNSDTRYLFARARGDMSYVAITKGSYQNEESVTGPAVPGNQWTNLTFTVSAADSTMKLYINGKLAAENANMDLTVSDLGNATKAYIGKSFYGNDRFANMKADNVEIYDRVLSADEIYEKFSPAPTSIYSLSVDAGEQGAGITPGTVGLFFEDLNTAADGGIYSEQINNRSFEALDAKGDKVNPAKIPGFAWTTVGDATAAYNTDEPLNNNNKTYLTLTAAAEGDGIENNCYAGDGSNSTPVSKGMNAAAGAKYNASLFVRGSYDGEIKMQIVSGDKVIGDVTFNGVTDTFAKKIGVITAVEDCDDARVRVVLSKPGTVDIDMISLIPQQTFNGRDNGLRADLVEKLALLHPGFLRFPGGCIIEGYNLANRYQWKQTVGPEEQRILNWNRWQTEGTMNYAYCQTFGLGFYEYFLLCEDLGAEPVPVLNVGLACQYQTKEASSKEDFYSTYLPDFLDLIEFANGTPADGWEDIDYYAVDTANPDTFGNNWANLRALMGHPESFDMKYIGVGNEQIDTSDYTNVDADGWADNGNNFFARYEAIEKAVHEEDPDMRLISTSGPSADDAGDQYVENGGVGAFSKAWNWANEKVKENPDFTYAVDEHYYKQPDWILANVNRYDMYDRDGAAVFAGEYASRWWEELRGNTWEAALSEAAFMTGFERNSDVVKMASFAPLFAKEGGYQWSPNMIWFDNADSYGTPDYYVQQMYSRNSGDYNVKTVLNDKTDDYAGIVGVGTWLTAASFRDLKVVNDDTGEEIKVDGWQDTTEGSFAKGGDWTVNEDGSAAQTNIGADNGTYLFANMEPVTARNFTVTLKATKTDGAEGFTVPIMAKDNNNLIHWNVGGWGNNASSFENRVNGGNNRVGDYVGTVLETGREYELKIVAKNGTLYGYIDGKLINTFNYDTDTVYANAIKDEATGDVIVKLINYSNNRVSLPIEIKNADLTGKATEYLMTGEFLDKNSLADPEKVAPVRSEIDLASGEVYTMPEYSFAVLRFHTGGTVAVNKIDTVELTVDLDSDFELPSSVTVYTGDGGEEQRSVRWILPEAGVFANEGTFKVFGRVDGTELDAVAIVTVVANTGKLPVIDADIDALIDGEDALISFNAETAGSYRGIVAVYGENGMESVQTVEFTGTHGEMTVKGADLTGKTVKIMLWTADGVKPVTDAVTVDPSANG